jgi:hypothetical protein
MSELDESKGPDTAQLFSKTRNFNKSMSDPKVSTRNSRDPEGHCFFGAVIMYNDKNLYPHC